MHKYFIDEISNNDFKYIDLTNFYNLLAYILSIGISVWARISDNDWVECHDDGIK